MRALRLDAPGTLRPLFLPDPLFHSREVTLFSSRNALAADFDHIITALEADQFNAAPGSTHHATLETASGAFPQWSNRNSVLIKGRIAN